MILKLNPNSLKGGFDVQASDGPSLDKHVKREYDRWQQFIKNTRLNLED